MYEIEKVVTALTPVFSTIAAIAAAVAAFKANEISNSLKRLQKNSILNQQEIHLLYRALELLKIYDVWCTNDGAGSNVNFNDSSESNYSTRDDAWNQIPRDIKFILIQLSSHSAKLEMLLSEWEEDFIDKIEDSYKLRDEKIKQKIHALREILSGGL